LTQAYILVHVRSSFEENDEAGDDGDVTVQFGV
jgi:hypothetical protein